MIVPDFMYGILTHGIVWKTYLEFKNTIHACTVF